MLGRLLTVCGRIAVPTDWPSVPRRQLPPETGPGVRTDAWHRACHQGARVILRSLGACRSAEPAAPVRHARLRAAPCHGQGLAWPAGHPDNPLAGHGISAAWAAPSHSLGEPLPASSRGITPGQVGSRTLCLATRRRETSPCCCGCWTRVWWPTVSTTSLGKGYSGSRGSWARQYPCRRPESRAPIRARAFLAAGRRQMRSTQGSSTLRNGSETLTVAQMSSSCFLCVANPPCGQVPIGLGVLCRPRAAARAIQSTIVRPRSGQSTHGLCAPGSLRPHRANQGQLNRCRRAQPSRLPAVYPRKRFQWITQTTNGHYRFADSCPLAWRPRCAAAR